jgi:hypothetical protein
MIANTIKPEQAAADAKASERVSIEPSALSSRAGLGSVTIADIKGLNYRVSQDSAHVFGASTIDRASNLHFGDDNDKGINAQSWFAPPQDAKLSQQERSEIETQIKQSRYTVVGDLPDGGKVYTDRYGNKLSEYPDGRKIYSTTDSNGPYELETRPDGSWTERRTDSDGALTVTTMHQDGSGMRITAGAHDTVGPQMDNVNTIWGPGGVFLQETMWNSATGIGTISKPGPDGELITSPLSH